ncbi:hypothetical protein PMAYCL1PPCAC_20333, partial [Pristionchus mayeri]
LTLFKKEIRPLCAPLRSTCSYEICNANNGGTSETKKIADYCYLEDAIVPHNQPISDQFFTALEDILSHIEAEFVIIDSIILNESFVSKLKATLCGHSMKSIEFNTITCDRITKDMQRK